jgi:dolichol-phosphate mannosyltransferase
MSQSLSSDIHYSVIVPVFNEAENVAPLYSEIVSALLPTGRSFEVLFVDDAGTDGTLTALEAIPAASFLRVLRHRINSGQSAAVATGFRAARGAMVATLDGDGQNDPSDLPAFFESLENREADCVCGVRAQRHDTWVRRVSSRVANEFRNKITGDQVSDSGCGIRALRRECLAEIPVFNGMHRFLPSILRFQGFQVLEREVAHRPRLQGVSKYGIHNRLWRGIVDCFAMRWFRLRAVPARREQYPS